MYKLIAIDIDGTLLDSKGEVTKKNKKAIEYAMSKNVEVVLTSGRMTRAVVPIANEINANKYVISGNGAQLYDIQNDKVLYGNYLSKQKVLEIIKICERNNIFYNIYTSNAILSKALNYDVLFFNNVNSRTTPDKRININIVNDMYSYIQEYEDNDILKISISHDDKLSFIKIMELLKEVEDIDILEVLHMSKKTIEHKNTKYEISYYYTEVTNQNVNKWSAIEKLLEKLDIKPSEVIAIGDNVNDKEMIVNAGLGITPKNSSPQMQEIANVVVSSNNESGVSEAIYKYIK